jgi:hypothetical protein
MSGNTHIVHSPESCVHLGVVSEHARGLTVDLGSCQLLSAQGVQPCGLLPTDHLASVVALPRRPQRQDQRPHRRLREEPLPHPQGTPRGGEVSKILRSLMFFHDHFDVLSGPGE